MHDISEERLQRFHELAHEKLNTTTGEIGDATAEFYSRVLEIDVQAVEVRLSALAIDPGITGWTALRELRALERESHILHERLANARQALELSEPSRFEQVEASFTKEDLAELEKYANKVQRQVNLTFDELERTRQTLSSLRTEATTHLSLSVTTGILGVSMLTLLASVLV